MAAWRAAYATSPAADEHPRHSLALPMPRVDTSTDQPRDAWSSMPYDYHHHPHPTFLSSPDPATLAYPGNVFAKPTSSASTGPMDVTCRFLHTQCDQELFNSEYLRSNKASGHKNLRCFPHCCGGHNPKSFCGSGLVVECSHPRVQIALGRFEELQRPLGVPPSPSPSASPSPSPSAFASFQHRPASTVQNGTDPDSVDGSLGSSDASSMTISVGKVYTRRELFAEAKSSENPFGMWFKGAAAVSATDASRFHLNGNRQSWHYGWQSSRLNCKNLHVFRVYFFQSNDMGETLRCVAALSSPPFRISSSRKARKTFKSSPSLASLGDANVSDDQMSMPRSSPGRGADDEDRMSIDSLDEAISLRLRPSVELSAPTTLATTTAASTMAAMATMMTLNSYAVDARIPPAPSSSFSRVPDVLPSLASRLSRGHTVSSNTEAFVQSHHLHNNYRGQPDRKRLTRSASLQTDYYSSSASAFVVAREPRARTYMGEELLPRSRGTRMPSLTSLLNADQRAQHLGSSESDHRQALPSIMVPPPLPLNHLQNQYNLPGSSLYPQVPVSTPVADMMQLRLETPRMLPRASSASSVLSSTTETSSFSSQLDRPSSKPRRKRNRSTDSSKPAHAGEGNQRHGEWSDGPLTEEIAPEGEWDLVAQAHAFGVLITVLNHIRRVPAAASPSSAKSSSHDAPVYEVISTKHTTHTSLPTVITPEEKPTLTKLCDVLVEAGMALIYQCGFLIDLRTRMHELLAGDNQVDAELETSVVSSCMEKILSFIIPRVEEQLANAMTAHEVTMGNPDRTYPSPIAQLIGFAEHDLVREPWWRDVVLFDDDDDEYPCMEFFADFCGAVQRSLTAPSLSIPKPVKLTGSLTGEWRLVMTDDDWNAQPPSPSGATVSSGSVSTATSWLHHHVRLHQSQIYRIVETADTLTLTLGNSLVSPSCPFVAHLNQPEPLTGVPIDHLPYALTRRRLLLAHKAWRVRGMEDPSGSAVTVQSMHWPREDDLIVDSRSVDADRQPQLLRTRITSHFSVVSGSRLQVRYVVEGSTTDNMMLCWMVTREPTERDMVEYFKAPASWEMITQTTLQYERA